MERLEQTTRKLRACRLGAFFRPRQLEAIGISYDRLQGLVEAGTVERVGWGLYHLTDEEPTEQHSLAAACARVPHSIVCLLSALQVHGIGTQLPREIWLAIPHKSRPLARSSQRPTRSTARSTWSPRAASAPCWRRRPHEPERGGFDQGSRGDGRKTAAAHH